MSDLKGGAVRTQSKQFSPSEGAARRIFLRLHQIVGLFAGAIFVLVGLSGGL
jgi:hypothetical protein